MTAREIIMEGNEGYKFRDVIDNLTEEQILDCMEEYAKQQNGYSKEEAEQLTLESLDLGMRIRQDQLAGYSEKSGKELHKEWFEKFKKK
jgi:hypothetical protein